MASAIGTAELDFGAFPGANEASVSVTGQTAITAPASVEAWFMADDMTTDHTAADHRYAPAFISLTCSAPSAGVGFTIYGRSTQKMQGKWAVRWVWAS